MDSTGKFNFQNSTKNLLLKSALFIDAAAEFSDTGKIILEFGIQS